MCSEKASIFHARQALRDAVIRKATTNGRKISLMKGFDERMSNIEFHSNNINGARAFSEGVASSRCPVDQQHRSCHYPVTADQ